MFLFSEKPDTLLGRGGEAPLPVECRTHDQGVARSNAIYIAVRCP